MKRFLFLAITALAVLAATCPAFAAGGGGAPIVIVSDTRYLSGVMLFWANLYNESHLYFTLLTVALIPTTGIVFGVLADIVMGWIGLDLKSRELAEH